MAFNRRQLFALFLGLCAMLIGCLFLRQQGSAPPHVEKHPHGIGKYLSRVGDGPIMDLHSSFAEGVKENRIKPEDFEQLKFTWPDDPTFGRNVDFEVFNPKSKRSIVKRFSVSVNKGMDLTQVATQKNDRMFFNLRRMQVAQNRKSNETPISDCITAVIPNLRADVCEAFGTVVSINIDLAADNSRLVNDVNDKDVGRGCIKHPDGKLYALMPIVCRHKMPNSDIWSIE